MEELFLFSAVPCGILHVFNMYLILVFLKLWHWDLYLKANQGIFLYIKHTSKPYITQKHKIPFSVW